MLTTKFDPGVYAGLSPEIRLYALGLMPQDPIRSFGELGAALGRDCANVTRLEESPALDTEAATRAKVERSPYSVQKVGREAIKRWIEPLAGYLAKSTPPRGFEQILHGLDHKQLAFLALRAILDQIHLGWDKDKRKARRKKAGRRAVKEPGWLFCEELGRAVRDELEFGGLLAAKRYVKASRNKHAALGRLKFRRVDWTRAECAQTGDWLWNCLTEMSCFEEDERGFPCFHADHKAAMDRLAEEVLFDHPLYKPKLAEPPVWTAWRMECPGDIGATFVKANDPETVASVQAAFEDGSIEPHARAVSAIQSVPLKINAAMLPLVQEFAGEKYRRDIVVAEALLGEEGFWNRVRCDRRGRLIQMCDFNYTRGDPVRSLFLFADGKPIGPALDWLEIAAANAYGTKGTWRERHDWVAANQVLIRSVAESPELLWRYETRAKDPFQFAAACMEYVAALRGGPEFITHLPVWLDASSNGLQHLALLRRDEGLARWVNLRTDPPSDMWLKGEPPVEISDIYEIIARYVETGLYADRGDPASAYWLDRKSDLRDLLKQPVMTLQYGASKWGVFDQIKEKCEERYGVGVASQAEIRKLRDHVWRAIREKMPKAVETMEYIQGIARHCLDHGAYMEWVTPSGFPVANCYRKSKTPRVRLPFLGQSVTIADGYTDQPRASKIINSAVANFVHSLDAAHLALSVNEAVARGITNLLTIHDCFGALASDTQDFASIRRWELAKMYLSNPLAALRALNLPLGASTLPLPDFGGLDVLTVGYSEYFDR
jgi:DNA-dependent RNA polymerase